MGEVKGPMFVNAVFAIAVSVVATFYTSGQVAVALGVSSLVTGVLNVVRTHLREKGVRKALVCIGICAAILMASSKLIMKYMPRSAPEAIIVGIQQGKVDDRVVGALVGPSQCNSAELALVVTATGDRDYISPVQCVGKVWEAKATIGRRDIEGNLDSHDANKSYPLRLFSGAEEIVRQAIKYQVIPPGLTKVSGNTDKGFTPGALDVNRFKLIQ
jgi:hypothetical protein